MIDLEGVTDVADIARMQARKRGAETALIDDGRRIAFAEIDETASRIAQRFLEQGIQRQERVAYLSKNSEHFFTFLFGVAKAGAALAPVNFRLAALEIGYIVEDSGARWFLVGPDFAELAEKAVAGMKNKPQLIALGFNRPGFVRHDLWIGDAPQRDPQLKLGADDDVIQLYTSGTTGLPKGVQLTHGNYLTACRLAQGAPGLAYDEGDVVLAAMPFFHVAGVNIAIFAMASGAVTAIVRDVIPAAVLDIIAREKVNHAFLAPAIILMLMNAPEMADADLSSMKSLSYGASPISDDLLLRAKARFACKFTQFYGMTETTGAGTLLADDAHDPALGKLRSCGKAWPGLELKIVDGAGREVGVGEVGEVGDVAVIGVPDEKWGEAAKAMVVLKPGASPNAESVIAWARERIAGFKAPRSVDFVAAIPRNITGKILRRELRKPFWEGRDRQVN